MLFDNQRLLFQHIYISFQLEQADKACMGYFHKKSNVVLHAYIPACAVLLDSASTASIGHLLTLLSILSSDLSVIGKPFYIITKP